MNVPQGQEGGMNHMWISPALDEKVVLKDAENKSRVNGPYQVHWHPEAVQCEAKYRHAIFAEGARHDMAGPF